MGRKSTIADAGGTNVIGVALPSALAADVRELAVLHRTSASGIIRDMVIAGVNADVWMPDSRLASEAFETAGAAGTTNETDETK